MPVGKYDRYFGGKRGAAQETLSNMLRQYGQKRGTSIFYATKNRNAKRRKHRGGRLSRQLRG